MNTTTQEQKFNIPKHYKYLLGFILLFSLSSMIPLSSERYASIDYHLSEQIKERMKITNLGNVQSLETLVIGPYTSIQLKYFKQNGLQISAKGYQLFWFAPIISCISSNPETICQ